jgi:hypothetical protein
VALAVSVAAGSAQGALLSFEDDDIDFVLNSDLTAKTTGTLSAGDVLVSVFEIPNFSINGSDAIPAGQELTGVAAVEIVSGTGTAADPWIMGAYSGGLNAILALGTDPDKSVDDGDAGEGATLAMWFNDANLELAADFNGGNPNCQSLAACVFEATRGDLYQVDGFAGDGDETWRSTTSALFPGFGGDIDTVKGTANTTTVANFFAVQTTLFQAGGFTIGGQHIVTGLPCVNSGGADLCIDGGIINGDIKGGAGLSASLQADGAFAHSDFDAQKLTIPEPGILALLAAGLLGIAGIRRRA